MSIEFQFDNLFIAAFEGLVLIVLLLETTIHSLIIHIVVNYKFSCEKVAFTWKIFQNILEGTDDR